VIAMKSAYTSGPIALAIVALAALAGCNDDVINVQDGPPAVPTGVGTVTGNGWVQVYWSPIRENDMAGYGVYRSLTVDGQYDRIATIHGVDNTTHTDYNVVNGVTYFYAVDAFDTSGHESALSYEDAFDTPRPAGAGVVLYALQEDPTRAGLDWSDYPALPLFVTAWDGPDTDIFVQRLSGTLYAKGTVIAGYLNDIQDLGWTETMDDVSWAPPDGWSASPNGVELIKGHTYVVWTFDSYYAKFRVTEIFSSSGLPSAILMDWAYQIDQDNPELSPLKLDRKRAAAPEGRDS
jgi:hypothetical protein